MDLERLVLAVDWLRFFGELGVLVGLERLVLDVDWLLFFAGRVVLDEALRAGTLDDTEDGDSVLLREIEPPMS